MSDKEPEEPASGDNLRRHTETAAEGPDEVEEPTDSADQLRQHAETAPDDE